MLCLVRPVDVAVGQADATGHATFDLVPMPNPVGFAGHELPVQAIYRDPGPGPCGSTWNASQAVLLPLHPYQL